MSILYKYVGYTDNINKEGNNRNGIRPSIVHKENVNTAGLIDNIVQQNYYPRPDASKAVEAVFASIERSLKEGRSVSIDGFGTFQLTAQFSPDVEPAEARRAESIEVKNVVFKATKMLKKRITAGRFKRLAKAERVLLEGDE